MQALPFRQAHLPSASGLHSPVSRSLRACIVSKWLQSRGLSTTAPKPQQGAIPLRKHLKDEAKRKKAQDKANASKNLKRDSRLDKWELTVGIEIHAELNTYQKLFSRASASHVADNGHAANSRVAPFDAALPGTQPRFQSATLLPAVRAALALECQIQRVSGWDRKHYFHWDQPNGYQITQYYRPFAKDGHLELSASDGVPAADLGDADHLVIGIKQIQMEQDTAKTTHHPPSTYHVDLNRAGVPLVEIITLPHIHSPQAAAAVVRKIQAILRSVGACVTGMELGGLRADVNVSVRQHGTEGTGSSYSGVRGLGQRTEIKNLSSFKAVEDAVVAERDRQISVLEAGGMIEGETRGWTLGASETTKLRGKEGEVDYRYMPDPDLQPLVIGQDLVDHLRTTLPTLPNEQERRLRENYGLTAKDAKTLVELDSGERVDFLEDTVECMMAQIGVDGDDRVRVFGRLASNWTLHELGGLLSTTETIWQELTIAPTELADILVALHSKQITSRGAKQLLATLFDHAPAPSDGLLANADARPTVSQLIETLGLQLRPLSEQDYEELANVIMEENPDMVKAVKEKGQKGKLMWFVGQMVRRGEERTIEPEKAREVVERLMGG
ncbi:hypothetical protein BAUCODRAFT_509456 [Baudoinia panamericana UAMH 10762]|uniref:Glutamyl-tRNA(Gln) amidotransferase subunit B, mitochondrial n=1 Tax=Baudoinia panamericana (strain UAMH 10762) TaxID=717646 RepID=M2NAR1_BAUPA|nr:uncharacterized protein BAUCODRAFT_509456 [Baudoinia panamericana UAMH 10762]EMC95930.1 hypothetical protein BAUCODRAFT_509456 [Baudoinia panamericana UAMH 10762]